MPAIDESVRTGERPKGKAIAAHRKRQKMKDTFNRTLLIKLRSKILKLYTQMFEQEKTLMNMKRRNSQELKYGRAQVHVNCSASRNVALGVHANIIDEAIDKHLLLGKK
ncbi:hypothetical protein G9A89_011006 [Geosiphon pyriformis]|nr:hypothetical protein G9A89_011006 [Geosiphon pyriformis]